MIKKIEEDIDKDRINCYLKNKMYNMNSKVFLGGSNFPGGIKVTTSKTEGYLVINLDWGQKSTGGYLLKILSVEEVDDTIVVYFTANEPGPNDIVPQVITYPKDSIRIKVKDISKEYKIILKGDIKKGYSKRR